LPKGLLLSPMLLAALTGTARQRCLAAAPPAAAAAAAVTTTASIWKRLLDRQTPDCICTLRNQQNAYTFATCATCWEVAYPGFGRQMQRAGVAVEHTCYVQCGTSSSSSSRPQTAQVHTAQPTNNCHMLGGNRALLTLASLCASVAASSAMYRCCTCL
jgi:hypothetical protein